MKWEKELPNTLGSSTCVLIHRVVCSSRVEDKSTCIAQLNAVSMIPALREFF
jgi:hypothetical protein